MSKWFALLFALWASCGLAAENLDSAALPPPFRQSIPVELKGGLKLVDLSERCTVCMPWRNVEFLGLTKSEPSRLEKVSVVAGYRALYAFAGTDLFANTKIEQSAPGHFDEDRRLMEEAVRHEYRRIKNGVDKHMAANPKDRERVESLRLQGHDYIELEEGERSGVAYVSYVANVIGLGGGTISQVQFFLPSSRITVTAYLLAQKNAKFKNIEEFRQLRQEFIDGYAQFLAAPP